MRLKSALRRGVAAAVIAGIVVSSGIPAYAKTWNIADGDITVKGASDESGNYNNVKQGEKDFEKDEGETVITGESDKNTVTIDTSEGNVDVTFDDLKIDVSGKTEVDDSGDSPVDAGKAAVTVQGDHDATIELDGDNELKSGGYNAGLEKNEHESEGTLTIKDDNGKDGSLTAEGGEGGAGIAEERRVPAAASPSGAARSRLWAGATRQASATVQAARRTTPTTRTRETSTSAATPR